MSAPAGRLPLVVLDADTGVVAIEEGAIEGGGFAKLKRVNEERRITFFFENDKLARIEGDTASLPSDAPPVSSRST